MQPSTTFSKRPSRSAILAVTRLLMLKTISTIILYPNRFWESKLCQKKKKIWKSHGIYIFVIPFCRNDSIFTEMSIISFTVNCGAHFLNLFHKILGQSIVIDSSIMSISNHERWQFDRSIWSPWRHTVFDFN